VVSVGSKGCIETNVCGLAMGWHQQGELRTILAVIAGWEDILAGGGICTLYNTTPLLAARMQTAGTAVKWCCCPLYAMLT
jgi:hypothetical protein